MAVVPWSPGAGQLHEMKKQGELYLSSAYRRIGPLMAALAEMNLPVSSLRSRDDNVWGQLLARWREIAAERGSATEETAANWRVAELKNTLKIITDIHEVWDSFESPPDTVRKVYRGDTKQILNAYPKLGHAHRMTAGYHKVHQFTIQWPGILSTATGREHHNFIQNKTVLWEITLGKHHPGRIIGSNNPAEQEVTFPSGTPLAVDGFLVRDEEWRKKKQDDFGRAELVLFAHIPENARWARAGRPPPAQAPVVRPSSIPPPPPPPPASR